MMIVNRKRPLSKILPTGEMMMVMRVVMTSGSYDGDNDEEPDCTSVFFVRRNGRRIVT